MVRWVTTGRGGSYLSPAVIACETASDRARVAREKVEAELRLAAWHAAKDTRGRPWPLPAKRPPDHNVPEAYPIDFGLRSLPVSRYSDGVQAGDYISFFDPVKAQRHDPCGETEYQRELTRHRLSGLPPGGGRVGYVVATFQYFGRKGSPVQIALHSGLVLDKRPEEEVWIEEASGRGCDFDGDCKAGDALFDLVGLLMDQTEQVHFRRLATDFRRRLKSVGHDEESVVNAWTTAERWGLMRGGRINATGKTWWYAVQRRRGIELAENAMPREQQEFGQSININGGEFHNSSFAAGRYAQATTVTSGVGDVADLVAQVVATVRARSGELKLSEDEREELQDALQVLEESGAGREVERVTFRMAVRSVARLAGSLLIGASGNAVWEALKALAG